MTEKTPSLPLARLMQGPKDTILGDLLQLAGRPEVISFAGGLPTPEGFPIEAIERSCTETIRQWGARSLQYSFTEGEPELREAIADWETRRGVATAADEVMIVSGSQQALDLVARLTLDEGSKVLVENPTYMGAISAFKTCAPSFALLPADDRGLNPEAIDASAAGARFAYVMPTYANPTGLTIDEGRRQLLAQKAREFDFWLVEDDPYSELWYDHPAPKSLRAWAPERTLRLGTLSKVLAPGLRLGYICGPKAAISRLALLKQSMDLHTATFSQKVAARIIASGELEAHLPDVRALYKKQARAMLQALDEFMPEEVSWTRVEGGMFIWMTLPAGFNTTALMREALERNIAFVPGAPFYANGGGERFLRLSFVTVPVDKIRVGIEKLGELLRSKL